MDGKRKNWIFRGHAMFGRSSDVPNNISLTYCRLRSLFHFPVLHASSPSATTVMEERMASQKSRPVVMVTESDVNAYLAKETGWDRLKVMYTKSEAGEYSKEVNSMMLGMANACGAAFLMASVFSGIRAKNEFIQKHKATAFKTQFTAQRLMNDKIMTAVGKDGIKWSFRIGSFLLPFMVISQSIAVYRNKSSPLEYAAGSAVAGFVIKINLGLKGGLSGAVIAGTMGLLTGSLIYGVLYAGGDLQESRHFREVQAMLEKEKFRSDHMCPPFVAKTAMCPAPFLELMTYASGTPQVIQLLQLNSN